MREIGSDLPHEADAFHHTSSPASDVWMKERFAWGKGKERGWWIWEVDVRWQVELEARGSRTRWRRRWFRFHPVWWPPSLGLEIETKLDLTPLLTSPACSATPENIDFIILYLNSIFFDHEAITIDYRVTMHNEKLCTACISMRSYPAFLKIFISILVWV